jgi:hypothetical protein
MAAGYLVSENILREIRRMYDKVMYEAASIRQLIASAREAQRSRGVQFRNDSGETVPRCGVMRVTGNEVIGNRPMFKTVKPDATFSRLYLVNGEREVSSGATGYGNWLHEADYASYNSSSGTPAYGEVWGPKSGQWTLEKYRSGFTIQGHTTTIDTVDVVLAVQAHVDLLIGKADAAIANGASGTCSVWMGAAGSEADTTWNVTAFNRSADIAEGEWASITCVHGQWYLAPLECPEEE